jgi:hypothetical protein
MSYVDEESIQSKLQVTSEKLNDAELTIAALEEENARVVRESKMEKILAPLSGKKREQMKFVLSNVETDKLEEAFNNFVGRILREDHSERQEAGDVQGQRQTLTENSSVVVTGDESSETHAGRVSSGDKHAHLKRLAGMTK